MAIALGLILSAHGNAQQLALTQATGVEPSLNAAGTSAHDAEVKKQVAPQASTKNASTPKPAFSIIKTLPHDKTVFTQGLELHGNRMYESSGLYGRSYIRSYHWPPKPASAAQVEPATKNDLPTKIFAEGLSLAKGQVHLLSWREQSLLSFDAKSLEFIAAREYSGEGWGLCHTGKEFAMSDGSKYIYFRDTDTFAVSRKVEVSNGWQRFTSINELECVGNYIWANMWQSDVILKIEADSGKVIKQYNLKDIAKHHRREGVLNGIAYDKSKQAFWLTGKRWSKIYLVEFTP